jgi:uncharacterized protein (TIGR00730 family)
MAELAGRVAAPRRLSICVYCASRLGPTAAHEDMARELGTLIGQRGWQLVYGGGRAGLMGVVADAALASGAPVVGVIPQSLMARERVHDKLTELHVVRSMHERKQLMAERSDAFVALPGGIGTLEELFEVWTWRQLGYHDKPVGLLNVGGYYDRLLDFIAHTVEAGYVLTEQRALLEVRSGAAEMLDCLSERVAETPPAPEDYSRT